MTIAPIRVLHVSHTLGLGGTEKVMQSFVTHLPRDRFSPAVFSFDDGPRGEQLRAARIPVYEKTDFYKALKKFQPQIVHLHRAGWPDPEPLRFIKRAGVPTVLETNVFGRFDGSPSAERIDHTLFVSHFCMDRYAQETKIHMDPKRYSVLYNPVNTDFFAKHSSPSFDAPVIGRISRPDPGKWSQLALDFLPRLVELIPNLQYRIIGGIPEAEAFVRDHGLEAHVEFLPPVQTDAELAQFLSSVSLLAHANDTGESFGLVIAEAMAAGLPVVTHPAKGLRDNAQLELVDHDKNGLIATDTSSYCAAIATLLTHPKLAQTMGAAGQKKAQALFRAQDIALKLADIYDELLTQKGIQSS